MTAHTTAGARSAAQPSVKSPRRRGIQSIEVGGKLLLALLEHSSSLPLGALAKAAGMSGANAHAYLVSYGNLGLVRQDASTGEYELGPLALQLGLAALHRLDPIKIAVPMTRELAEKTGQTIAIAVLGNLGPVIVHLHESNYPIHVNMRTGTVMSLTNTATGKVFAALLPPKKIESLLHEDFLRLGAVPSRARSEKFEQTLKEVRQRGVARAVGDPIPGINGLSAPVFDSNGNVVLVITAIGAAGVFDARWSSPLVAEIRQCADAISAELGWQNRDARASRLG
ncbi:IclR family transcriptional regulator [Achromobacter pulmonis]|uniref:IclR family transcriptional regulator n=1 Tax=Achromobacter pulmonis TaxID=1389932 RepID=A0A2N8KC80_9BURK|nr:MULTISPECIES: IclR family transcriptional regulator [Achromobacter]MBO9330520.1 helix-turn-helix domain-containing protein [Achromobacter xylosoxidans]PND31071.1 IclR family transcriptional regulator [Achromobacter pulmonis]